MGALRQPRPVEPERKPPNVEKLDKYGRNPNSLPEKLRARTDYAKNEGWAPFPHAVWSDLPRLSSGAICFAFVGVVNMLSLGRQRKPGQPWHEWTEPISKADLAELCCCDEKGIQRQIAELAERGMIAVKQIRNGVALYSISLLYSKWQAIEDYAVWKRRQVVSIDDAAGEDESEDETPSEISKDAVKLTRGNVAVRPGRASKAVKVSVGVKELSFQNDSPIVDAAFSAVVTSGRLVVSATFRKGESDTKGETKANAVGHRCPDTFAKSSPSTKGNTRSDESTHPRAEEICKLFDPLLQKSGARLISPDSATLKEACEALAAVPHDFLLHFVMGPNGRGGRPISGPRAVVSILKECRANFDKQPKPAAPKMSAEDFRADELARARSVLADSDSSMIDIEWAKEVLGL